VRLPNHTIWVACLATVLFVPFLGAVHLFDWDEINFAESAREMLLTGEYFRVQINFQPFWEKPPLFFWLQAGCMRLFGVTEFAARLPNALCGICTLSLLFYIGKNTINSRFAWLWVLFMAGSITPALYFKSGIIDPWFNLFIFFAIWQLSLAAQKANTHSRTWRFALIGLALGLAVLTKGPVALLIAFLCAAVYWVANGFSFFFTVKHIAVCVCLIVAISSLWVMVEVMQNGWGVLSDFINYQIDLFKNPVAGHGQPWYYHLVVLLIGCFPASIFGIKGFYTPGQTVEENALKQWMTILFWVVLVLFSMVTTKIVHYSSLCWIPLTFMAAFAIDKHIQHNKALPKYIFVLFVVIAIIISSLLTALPLINLYKHLLIPHIKDSFAVATLNMPGEWNGFEWLLGFLLLIVLIYGTRYLSKQNLQKAIAVILTSIMIFVPTYMLWVVPKIEYYSQRPAIEFYQSLQGKNCYAETLGMKSYAQYFYTQCQPHTDSNYHNIGWLLEGPIDKETYFVSKINRVDEIKKYGPVEIGRKGGFVFWKREAVR
jgi:4-amino-4-deoxy-L-arabinose transferase-like glycosyltransferase